MDLTTHSILVSRDTHFHESIFPFHTTSSTTSNEPFSDPFILSSFDSDCFIPISPTSVLPLSLPDSVVESDK